ncbi:hypothetical protein FJU08_06680 [Martelella alba]|uniref:Protein phosphatase 2C-like protein n=1 Tax=Martelella alba TaxID=2590451 RepID=A0A506UAK4_9HYPH|nr:hypothetical protein [Martelella alba]TPW31442.1 hypothetical protein FJU08_06680 [Martelella alba]
MTRLTIIDHITDPGTAGGTNDDSCGWTEESVFVIDGATGLADRQYMAGHGSDAAWLAHLATEFFEKADGMALTDTVRALNERAGQQFSHAAEGEAAPRHGWPAAAFQMLRIEGNRLVTHGLGDCRLFLLDANKNIFQASALEDNRERETASAAAHIERVGGLAGLGRLNRDPETLASLRAGREKHNTEGGRIWTLGLVPDAADHIVSTEIAIALPAYGLVCSDGFAALCDAYDLFDPGSLVSAARSHGLLPLINALRDIERTVDPDGQKFPRFKVSDDATAVLFALE